MTEPIKTLSDVEALAAAAGIVFTPEDYAQAAVLADQRRMQLEAEHAASEGSKTGTAAFVDRFNRLYPKFLQALLGIGDVLITATQTVLIAFGVPTVLLMLLIVEQQRVYHGVELFEVHSALAAFSATALVVLNLILELLISWIEHRSHWVEPPKYEFSFMLVTRRLVYVFGKASGWEPAPKSPALRFKVVLRIVTISILTLALAGSMRSVIEQTGGNWAAAIQAVLTQSTLLQAATWLGGLLFAVAAVLSAQALSQYVAVKVVEVVAIMQSSADNKPQLIADAAGLTGAMYLYGRLKDSQRTRRTMAHAADMPTVSSDLSGMVAVSSVPVVPDGATVAQDNDVTSGQKRDKRTKIDTALDMLLNDRTLRYLTTRELEEKTGIGRNTWATAKKRIGL